MATMQVSGRFPLAMAVLVLGLAVRPIHGQSVLSEVPPDALGFVAIRNLERSGAAGARLSISLGRPLPNFFHLLTTVAGLDEGLDAQGDGAVVMLQAAQVDALPIPLVILPVTDYGRLLKSLGADPSGQITPIFLLGEEVLLARKGNFAVMMNPENRELLQEYLQLPSQPFEPLGSLADWMRGNDATAVVLPSGLNVLQRESRSQFSRWSRQQSAAGREAPPRVNGRRVSDQHRLALLSSTLSMVRRHVKLVALGVRADDEGHAKIGLRGVLHPLPRLQHLAALPPLTRPLALGATPHSPIIVAEGEWDESLTELAAKLLPRYVLQDPEFALIRGVANRGVEKLSRAVEYALRGIQRGKLFWLSGNDDTPIYHNVFAVLEVEDTAEYLQAYEDAVRIWNDVFTASDKQPSLHVTVHREKYADKEGINVELDVAAVIGGPELPEVRTMLTKLFGPDGKLVMRLVAIDHKTIAIGRCGRETMLDLMQQRYDHGDGRVDDSVRERLAALDDPPQWAASWNPASYRGWWRRAARILNGQAIGAQPPPAIPPCPPALAAARITDEQFALDVTIPSKTMDALGAMNRAGKQ